MFPRRGITQIAISPCLKTSCHPATCDDLVLLCWLSGGMGLLRLELIRISLPKSRGKGEISGHC